MLRLFKKDKSPFPNKTSTTEENKTPTIEEINTAILMGFPPTLVLHLLLQGNPVPDVNGQDAIGLSPIHMAFLIPQGLYRHSPLSVVLVLVSAGASCMRESHTSIPAQAGRCP